MIEAGDLLYRYLNPTTILTEYSHMFALFNKIFIAFYLTSLRFLRYVRLIMLPPIVCPDQGDNKRICNLWLPSESI